MNGVTMQASNTVAEPYLARKDIWIVLAVWLILTALFVSRDWQDLIQSTGSTDDTMRLHTVRDLLSGKGWFAALHDARLSPPLGLDNHWSRLVDIPIALLILMATPFLGQNGAEIFTMAAWPALLYLALIAGFIAVGKRLAESTGFLPMIAGAIGCAQIGFLFRSTAIDHHNVMLVLAVWLFACVIWIDVKRHAAIAGGMMAAAMIAIGFESLHIYAALNVYVVLRAFFDPSRYGKPVKLFLAIQALCILAFWLITVPPHLLAVSMCDAIAINGVMVCIGACLTAAGLIHFGQTLSVLQKSVAAGAALAVITAIAIAMEPMCLKGPNAMIDPRAVEVWLSRVLEAKSIFALYAEDPGSAVFTMLYPALCLIAFIWLRSKKAMSPELYALLACVALATLVTMAQRRGSTYSSLFGAVFLTLAITKIQIREPFGRIARMVIPGFVSVLFVLVVEPLLFSSNKTDVQKTDTASNETASSGEATKKIAQPCATRWGFPALDGEPVGYVLSHLDLGPSLLLTTNHKVMMAPYHRISKTIAKGSDMIVMPAATVHEKLLAEGITHLADCTELGRDMAPLSERADKTPTLEDVMRGDYKVDWAEALPVDPRRPEIKIWRVRQ
jgi:hypothetical protein